MNGTFLDVEAVAVSVFESVRAKTLQSGEFYNDPFILYFRLFGESVRA